MAVDAATPSGASDAVLDSFSFSRGWGSSRIFSSSSSSISANLEGEEKQEGKKKKKQVTSAKKRS